MQKINRLNDDFNDINSADIEYAEQMIAMLLTKILQRI